MSHIALYRGLLRGPVTVLLVLASQVGVWAGAGYPATADIRFQGTSTLHEFKGSAQSPLFVVQFTEEAGRPDARMSTKVSIGVASLTTGHEKRDKNMRKMLDLANFAVMEGIINDALVPADGEGEVTLLLKIRDKTNPVTARLSEWRVEGDDISFHLSFSVSLKAFGLKPPSVLGLIRVGDEVSVACDVHPPSQDPTPVSAQETS